MKIIVYFILIRALIACNDSEIATTKTDAADNSVAAKVSTPATDISGPAKATIDMGSYIFRVHEIVQYHPSQMQAEMLKLNDSKSDFYVLNCSVESKSDVPIDLGQVNIAAYFTLSNGTSFDKILRGGFILGGFGNDNASRYNKDECRINMLRLLINGSIYVTAFIFCLKFYFCFNNPFIFVFQFSTLNILL